ncbi:AI-2E family transporter [Lutibaculum baratangense]|uniref:Putative transport protein n=1 Tax=Lutibaculum baratangense AMV1 TaxID=631454 RepID=V4R9E9_9HYPH|nr:AI-2E family transporter [Lutibaculum baratangense]ESR22826.1 putative transport protein [Lutibaculum baratangense AMV1]
MNPPSRQVAGPPAWYINVILAAIVIAGLWWARAFLVPIVVALMLFVLLNSMINRIAGFRVAGRAMPRGVAAAIGIAIIAFVLFVFTTILSQQVNAVVEAMPRYLQRMDDLVRDLGSFAGEDLSADFAAAFREINLAERLPRILGSAGAMLTGISLVVLYLAFMFTERPVFWSKLGRVLDAGPEHQAHHVIRAINESIERYFWVKLVVSSMTGLAAYAVMKPLGLDFAETWALLAFILNFIPNIGSVIATIAPTLVALVQFDTLGPFLIVGLGVTAIELFIGNVVEPALMGRSLNLSPLVIILSLTFWGALWGVVGMFLSVPIMVTVLIVASQVPAWRWVAVVLSNDGDIPSIKAPGSSVTQA